ncbi:insulinase family protein [Shimia sp. CNT1-13L.2]|uniref:M16 family metallopeptidase n=1 Tax=Shimia sp. CNT1-13L.2 TaxID=2959663 RepID=UPI0020CBD5F9|nr:pitrilysin family protein [Shimia sp. CNT1-13L.2]MCP9480855.1 insulinase family protein [Shimia sp. CNT1-13L.2]
MIRFLSAILVIVFALPVQAGVEIKEVTSPGGIKAWLVEEPSIPFVALEVRFKGGASLDAPGKRGATNLMVGLLEEGAGDLDSQGFAEATEALAAQFSYDVGDDTLSVSARFLTENRDAAVQLLRSSIVEPRFDPQAVERVRAQVLASIRSSEKDPDEIASRSFDALAFGEHPYGSQYAGTQESVAALTREDIIAAHDGAMARDRLFVSAVGDITAEELGFLLDDLLGELPAEGAKMPVQAELMLKGGTTVVEFDTPQSVALFGHEGIDRHDDDFFAAYVLNVILGGGGFESRLMEEVRVKRGLTYGVYSYLAPKDHAALYIGSVSSANDRISEAVDVIRSEWAHIAKDGVTEEELAKAKALLTGAYPLRFDGNGSIARIMVGMQMDDLPIDYIETRNDKVNAVTLEDVNRVASELLRPEDLHFVIVGKPEGV